jgi:hypothetical protein
VVSSALSVISAPTALQVSDRKRLASPLLARSATTTTVALRAVATRTSLLVRGRRHVQGPADRLDAEALAMLIDERTHFGRSASSSVAKNSEAAFRISFARRSSYSRGWLAVSTASTRRW